MNAKSNGNREHWTTEDYEAELFVLTGERNSSRRAAGRYKADRDRLRREINSHQATIEMLSNLLHVYYKSYTSEEQMPYDDFVSSEEWLEEAGLAEVDRWRDADGKPLPATDIPF